ncbi:metallophosphoesterase family protein [Actinomadura madurae]|uniref:metallophosphoesterase family protein n=1 Tax=Actinomadura madurae TaxID=1993 RepID=UPI0020D224E3|nr:metallophosphoesterase [Actinomadura madurae]MCQ0014369.1 metallophosphoesterase [Actinomadura madurae]
MGVPEARHLQRPAARARPRLLLAPAVGAVAVPQRRGRAPVRRPVEHDPPPLRGRAARAGHAAAFTVHRSAPEFSFALLGDTGEGDRSQYAVVPPLLHAAAGTDFMIIASDVIYPTGDAGEYPEKLFRPYKDYPAPIFAVPGNHDWYDGLRGFLHVFCDLDADCSPPPWRGPLSFIPRLLWRHSGTVDPDALAEARRTYRGAPGQQGAQPGPYWAIDTPSLRVVGIDTGITGALDREQARWLREVSGGPKPKLLVTGKPLYVDDERRPGRVEGGGTVDEIVRDPAHNYVAAIGGDIHNYQRYPVRTADGRTIQYIVAGGGGAFMHATHTIPRTRVVEENEFRCYPLRGDSLSRYSKLYGRWLRLPKLFELTPRRPRPPSGTGSASGPAAGTRGPTRPAARASSRPCSAFRVTAAAVPGSYGCPCTSCRSGSARNWPTGTRRPSSRASCAWTSPSRISASAATRRPVAATRRRRRRARTR